MTARERMWAWWFLFLVISAFVVPYTVLSNVPKIWGAFAFWNIFGVIAILSMWMATAGWRDEA